MREVDVEEVQLSILFDYVALVVDEQMCVVALVWVLLAPLLEAAEREPDAELHCQVFVFPDRLTSVYLFCYVNIILVGAAHIMEVLW